MGVKDTLNPAFVPSLNKEKEQKTETKVAVEQQAETSVEAKRPDVKSEVTSIPAEDSSKVGATSLFPELEAEKLKEEVIDLSPRPFNGLLEPHHRDGSMILDASRNLGYLKDLTPYGATFQPLELTDYQIEKAMLYI